MRITDAIKLYFGSQIVNEVRLGTDLIWPKAAATGGIETVYEKDGKYYRLHTFNEDGDLDVDTGGFADILIVAGGGGGAHGGGGAGGVLFFSEFIHPGVHPVVVGEGGASQPALSDFLPRGDDGEDSSFLGHTAKGGGGGAVNSSTGNPGGDGGSGGGSHNGTISIPGEAGEGEPGQGHDGGSSLMFNVSPEFGGGGGGAGGPGEGLIDPGLGPHPRPKGGPGRELDISGQLEVYGIGGEAGQAVDDINVVWDNQRDAPRPNRGDGGHGSRIDPTVLSMDGSSGVVMVLFEITQAEHDAE